MLHSLIHNITLEFTEFSQKNSAGTKKKKKTTEDPSYLEKRMKEVYQQNNC